MDIMDLLRNVALLYIPFLFAICFHEYAHGWVAKRLGDPTAELMGRVSMNPVVHMDLLGTVIFPLAAIIGSSPLFFGWAKPVPVNINNLRDKKNGMFWVALAGPASNFFLAILGFFLMALRNYLPIDPELNQNLLYVLRMFIYLNLFLAVFNLIPVHPLDGGKILARFLPYKVNRWLEENSSTLGMVLLFLIIFDGISGSKGIITAPVDFLYNIIGGSIGYFLML